MSHHFLSHSKKPVHHRDLVLWIGNRLRQLDTELAIWFDDNDLRIGENWDADIEDALDNAASVVYFMSQASTNRYNFCRKEVNRALRHNKPITMVRIEECEPPIFLDDNRQWIELLNHEDKASAAQKLRDRLRWLMTPQGERYRLEQQLGYYEYERMRASSESEPDEVTIRRLDAKIRELKEDIAHIERIIADPEAARRATEALIERDRAAEVAPPSSPASYRVPTYGVQAAPAAEAWQGRDAELAQLAAFVRDAQARLLHIVGRAGIGKTALAVHVARALAEGALPGSDDPLDSGGVIFLSSSDNDPLSATDFAEALLQVLPDEQSGPLRDAFRNPTITAAQQFSLLAAAADPAAPIIAVLDNFESNLDADGSVADSGLDEALRTILAAPTTGLQVLLTTRLLPRTLYALPGIPRARQKQVALDEGLPHPHAENLLRALDADGKLGLRDAAEADLTALADAVLRFPRALEAATVWLESDGTATLHDIIADINARDLTNETVVEALVGQAYRRLDPAAQRAAQVLAIFGEPVKAGAVASVMQATDPDADAAHLLKRLVAWRYARSQRGSDLYSLHPVDAAYALAQLPPGTPEARREAAWTRAALYHRAADWYAGARQDDPRRIDDLQPQLREVEMAYQGGDYERAADVFTDIDTKYLLLWGHARDVLAEHQRLLPYLPEGELRSISLNNLGIALQVTGQAREAIPVFEELVQHERNRTNKGGEGTALGNLGIAYRALGQVPQAIDHYQQALAIAREIGDRRGEGADLGNLGSAYRDLGQVPQAIDHYQQALAISREIGDRQGEGNRLGGLGSAYRDLGQVPQAIDYFQQALVISREIGDRRGEGNRLGGLGIAYRDLGQVPQAIDHYQQALAIAREIGDRTMEGNNLGNLGSAYRDLGQVPQAIEHYQQALEIHVEIGARYTEAMMRFNLALAYRDKGDLAAALAQLERAVALEKEVRHPDYEQDAQTLEEWRREMTSE